jgi:hypothetical protein
MSLQAIQAFQFGVVVIIFSLAWLSSSPSKPTATNIIACHLTSLI